MPNKYIVLMGAPGSGKSTWAREYMTRPENSCTIRVNRDDVRRANFKFGQWNEYKFTKEKENKVTALINEDIAWAAERDYDIIDDNTNLNPRYLKKTEEKAKSLGYEVEYVQFFDIPLHKLIERDIYRQYSVGEDVVHRMFRAQLELQGRIIEPVDGLPGCIIVDVDGTIADMGKDEHWGRGPFEWDKVSNDKPKRNVCKVVSMFVAMGKNVIFLTGRDGVALKDTKNWINQHIMLDNTDYYFGSKFCPAEIFIREAGDMRCDTVVKEELLRKYILPRYNVSFVMDDRKRVTDHYRALGLEVWQVDHGRF